MGKGKLTLLDVRGLVKELRGKLLGLRVANIYHLNAKTFLLKLSGSEVKETLLVESGARLHTTKYNREHDKMPSNFAAKLRKHLRLSKLEDIQQVGNDRIVDLQFGRGEKAHHLILEFYDQGNIILTDHNLDIIMLLRTHSYGAPPSNLAPAMPAAGGTSDAAALPAAAPALVSKVSTSSSKSGKGGNKKAKPAAAAVADDDEDAGEDAADDGEEDRVAVRARYPMSQVQMPQQHITLDMIETCLQRQVLKERAEQVAFEAVAAAAAAEQQKQREEEEAAAASKPAAAAPEASAADASASAVGPDDATFRNQQGKKQQAKEQAKIDAARRLREEAELKKRLTKPKMRQGMPIKAVLAQDLHFGPDIIEHCLAKAGIDPNQTTAAFVAAAAAQQQVVDPQAPVAFSPARLAELCAALQEAPKLLERIATEPMPGYIFYKIEQQDGSKPEQKQQQQQQPAQKKPKQPRRNAAGELVVDDIDVGASVAAAAVAANAAAPAAASASTQDAAAATPAACATAAEPTATASSSAAASSGPVLPTAENGSVVIYTEFVPMLLAAHTSRPEYTRLPPPLQFPSLDDALDEFYSKQEAQKEEMRLIKEKAQALLKLEREKTRQAQQLAALANQQALSTLKAQLIEQNLDAVNACIGSVNAEVAKGIDWRELTRTIKAERETNNNPIARMIHSLRLLENHITVTLSEGMQHLLPLQPGQKRVEVQQVELDLGLSAFANAQLYYANRKQHAQKQQKAESASALALKAAERKTNVALSAVDQRARIQKTRKIYWWERFNWFISSENFLVIGGKDMQQNEQLVKKYLRPRDIYVHADVHGASSVIVKNHTNGPVPPLTLSQAGSMTICRSAAWKDKIVVEAYWVHADQVSKTAPTGLSLPTGSFMIRGRRNFMPRMPLVMGIGLLFRLDDSCRAKHAGERRVRAQGEEGPHEEDKFDQVGDLPGAAASGEHAGDKRSGSSKKKSSSSSKKKKPARAEASEDFDVTSSLRPAASAAAAVARLTSEDEGTDAEAEDKRARLAKLPATSTSADADAAADEPNAKAPPAGGKKKISAAERKRMKKGTTARPSADSEAAAEDAKPAAEEPAPAAVDSDSSSEGEAFGKKKRNQKKKASKKPASGESGAAAAAAPASGLKPLPRGKRGKAKRVADKYKDQDEEDLILAASLLGLQGVEKKKQQVQQREKEFHTAGKKQTQQQQKQESSESEEGSSDEEGDEEKKDAETGAAGADASADAGASAAAAAAAGEEDSSKVCFGCKQRGHVFKACPNKADPNLTLAAARRAAESAEESERARLMAEEGLQAEEDAGADAEANSAAQAEQELGSLTGRPFPDDLLHFALPVCAPYDALSNYKFRLKLLPGVAKKGKAAKQALQLFAQADKITREESELLKLVPEQEVINVLVSNAKLSVPQGDGKRRAGRNPGASKTAE